MVDLHADSTSSLKRVQSILSKADPCLVSLCLGKETSSVRAGELYAVLIAPDSTKALVTLNPAILSLEDREQNRIVDGIEILDIAIPKNQNFDSDSDASTSVYIALLPIPPALKTGNYILKIRDIEQEKSHKKFDLRVEKRIFLTEKIVLNSRMEQLKKPSPKVTKEAQSLYAITAQGYPEAIFGFDNFLNPLTTYLYDTSDFGTRRLYKYADGKEVEGLAHTGIDLVGPANETVRAPESGLVIFARSRVLTGNTIAIAHFPQMISVFYHLNSISVEENQVVERGARIGTQGSTGFSTGEHLHWEIRLNNTRVDPRKTLLPLDRSKIIRILL